MERTAPVNGGIFTAAMLPRDYPSFDGSQSCAREDADEFFPNPRDAAEAQKRVCRSCPFVQPCGSYALFHPEEEGVWGAMTEADRRRLRSRMRLPA